MFFFDFFTTAPNRMTIFGGVSGRHRLEMVSKVDVLDGAVMKKSKKHHAIELTSVFLSNTPSLLSNLEHAPGSAGSPEVVSRTAVRSPPPTRAGGQDDGSYTNSLK